jgi:hypothetical protein
MKFVTLLILAAVTLASSGCLSLYRAQLEKKLPKIDAEYLKVTGHTIYGVSGEITETDVEWKNNVKHVGSQSSRVDSPLGSVTVEAKKAKIRQ